MTIDFDTEKIITRNSDENDTKNKQDLQKSFSKNPRFNLTAKKYKKQVSWRRQKVKELLFKGYTQQEIISKLHMSQSTISRDISYIHDHQESEIQDYGKLLFENHFDIVNGTTELLKRAWEILDNPKSDFKTKNKMMNFMMDLYSKRIELFQGLPYAVVVSEEIDEINRKEKYFKDHNIVINYEKPMSMEEFDKSYKEQILKRRKEEALF